MSPLQEPAVDCWELREGQGLPQGPTSAASPPRPTAPSSPHPEQELQPGAWGLMCHRCRDHPCCGEAERGSGKLPDGAEPMLAAPGSTGWPGMHEVHAAFFSHFALDAGEAASQDLQLYREALTSDPQQDTAREPWEAPLQQRGVPQPVPLCSRQLFFTNTYHDPCQEHPGPANGRRSPLAPQ